MHKNDACGSILFDEKTGRIVSYKDNGEKLSPYLGNADLHKIQKWWEMRAVPASRAMIQDIIRNAGCLNTELYLAKNLALSMTDAYWVCPDNTTLTYDQVKFQNFETYNDGKIPYHNATSYDYNASLGGQMEKYWDLDHSTPDLVKESSKFYGQQSVNEVVATRIHELQNTNIPFVKYTAEIVPGHGIISHCDAFTSENIELISAYEIVESCKNQNSMSLYDHYISTCVKNGIDQKIIQDFMDYQTMTDFVISNTDEHLNNFGVLRDATTMGLLGPAPIYDSGNSMFYKDEAYTPLSRAGLLARPITSFYKTEDKMLAKVQDRNILKLDLLPSAEEIKSIYINAGIPEQKANFISKNYETKLELVKEFQHGKTISLYQEKEVEKAEKNRRPVLVSDQKIMVLCGVPGSGKTDYANNLLEQQKQLNRPETNGITLYSVKQAYKETSFVYSLNSLLQNCEKQSGYQDKTVMISANGIRKELQDKGLPVQDSTTFLTAKMRIKTALISGADVIYDAANMSYDARKDIVELAKAAGITNLQLYVMPVPEVSHREDIDESRMNILKQRFLQNYPTQDEGWSQILQIDLPQRDEHTLDTRPMFDEWDGPEI